MPIDNLVLVHHFCLHHQVEISFIDSLQEYGLVDIQIIDDNKYILQEDLKEVEKLAQFYYDLGINLEGIDVISNLLMQNAVLRRELGHAQKRLNLFELDIILE